MYFGVVSSIQHTGLLDEYTNTRLIEVNDLEDLKGKADFFVAFAIVDKPQPSPVSHQSLCLGVGSLPAWVDA
jgi:hypothetical protein